VIERGTYMEIVERPISKNYLVIKVGRVYSLSDKSYLVEDPVVEIDKVLQKNTTCYFAKFGNPIKVQRIDEMLLKSDLFLVIAYKLDEVFTSKTYKVISSSYDIPPKQKNYPPYYKKKIDFVGNWIEVAQTDEQVPLSHLKVTSSYQSVISAMTNTSGSVYYCKK
jgi:hypothetical protein